MVQRYSQSRTAFEKVDALPAAAHPVVVVSPRAIVRGPDGRMTWVARCPRCPDGSDESIVTGTGGAVRGPCPTCGAIVEVRENGIYSALATTPPPEE